MSIQIISTLIVFIAVSTSSYSQTIYVDHLASGSNSGEDWGNAFSSLQDALNMASSGDTIWVAKGTYKPTENLDRDASFLIKGGIVLLGGFVGTEIYASERNWNIHETILSGNIGIEDQNDDNVYHVVTIRDNGVIELDGFNIRNGSAKNESNCGSLGELCSGGGIYIDGTDSLSESYIKISNCKIENNNAVKGGGIFINASAGKINLELFDLLLRNNQTSPGLIIEGGGAIGINSNNGQTNIKLSKSLFEENTTSFSVGGGIMYEDDDAFIDKLSIDSCQFYNNYSPLRGGAIFLSSPQSGSVPRINNCEFQSNGTNIGFEQGTGGAIDAGGYYEIYNSIFKDNYAYKGGALYEAGSNSQIVNCIFYNNEANNGGAIHQLSISNIINCTFYGNNAMSGGALSNEAVIDTIYNSIFWNNSANEGSDIATNSFSNFYFENCLLSEDICSSNSTGILTCGPNIIFDDPLLSISENGYFSLHNCSPAVNAGDISFYPQTDVNNDVYGNFRVIDHQIDLGAVETHNFQLMIDYRNSCDNSVTGEITLIPINGIQPYEYQWSNINADSIASNLGTGTYYFTVTDANNCQIIDSIIISESDPISASYIMINAMTNNSSDGNIILDSITGGTPPYQFNWNNGDTTASLLNIPPGEYTLTVSDSNNCLYNFDFEISFLSSLEQETMNNITLSPNPVPMGQNIKLYNLSPDVEWKIILYDSQGKNVSQSLITQQLSRSFTLQTNHLLSGTYWILISTSDGQSTNFKLVVI